MRTTNPRKAFVCAALLLSAATLCQQSAMRAQTVGPTGTNKPVEIDVAGTTKWVDTNLNVRGGAKLRFTATGSKMSTARTPHAGLS
jgi:hypothetical protein